MKSETVTVIGKGKGRCMRTTKEKRKKARFKKVIRCCRDRRKKTNCQRHSPFTVVQKNLNSVLVEADGAQYCRNVTHVKKNLERDNVPQATSK